MKNIKLWVAPTRRFCFSVEDAHKYKKLVEDKLKEWNVDFVNIDSINREGLLINAGDSKKAAELFKKEKVDAVFSPHVNFGTEEVVAGMAKEVGKPFLLWGPRDESPLEGGVRLRDTQCRRHSIFVFGLKFFRPAIGKKAFAGFAKVIIKPDITELGL